MAAFDASNGLTFVEIKDVLARLDVRPSIFNRERAPPPSLLIDLERIEHALLRFGHVGDAALVCAITAACVRKLKDFDKEASLYLRASTLGRCRSHRRWCAARALDVMIASGRLADAARIGSEMALGPSRPVLSDVLTRSALLFKQHNNLLAASKVMSKALEGAICRRTRTKEVVQALQWDYRLWTEYGAVQNNEFVTERKVDCLITCMLALLCDGDVERARLMLLLIDKEISCTAPFQASAPAMARDGADEPVRAVMAQLEPFVETIALGLTPCDDVLEPQASRQIVQLHRDAALWMSDAQNALMGRAVQQALHIDLPFE